MSMNPSPLMFWNVASDVCALCDQVTFCDDDRENYRHNEDEQGEATLLVRVSCNNKAWTVRRTLAHFSSLDRQLHRCIFDRKFSQLPELVVSNMDVKNSQVSRCTVLRVSFLSR